MKEQTSAAAPIGTIAGIFQPNLAGEDLRRMEWYCVHTRPQKEGRAATRLREVLGLETYFPRLRRRRTIRRVRRIVTGPLFPRYLFCRFDFSTQYRAVRYAQDVIDVVSFGHLPAVVDDALIEELKAWAGESIDVITLQACFRPGDRVEITDGPFRGLQAVIENEMNGRERVAIILSILERDVQTTISRWQIARVE
jgi:transcriptional antiterminator RfaH